MNRQSGFLSLACAVLLICMLTPQLPAQTFLGDILGTVTDTSGAVVPNATLTLKNLDKSVVVREVTSGQDGGYIFSRIDPARYEISATASGFKRYVVPSVVLPVGTRVTVDIGLELGAVTTTIEVKATTALVKPDDVVVGQVVTEHTVTALPLNGRNFLQLAQLSPGVQAIGSATSPVTDWTGRTDLSIVVAGLRETDSSYLLDGIETRSPRWGGSGFRPSVDAVQEFNIERNAFPADQGWGTTVVNTIIRSGSNAFHGSIFEFIRNDNLDARNFFDPENKPPFKQNQFGATGGGPILKDKLFFFGDYEGFRQRISNTFLGRVPTAEVFQGKFTNPIIDPTTGAAFPQDSQGFYVIPAGRFDSVAKNVIPFWPAANRSVAQDSRNYQRAPNTKTDTNQILARIDYNLSSKDQIFGHFAWVDEPRIQPSLFEGFGLSRPLGDTNIVVGDTHVLSAAVVNELRLGYNRNRVFNTPETANGPDLAKQIGLKETDTNPLKFALPLFAPNDIDGIGQGFSQTQQTIDEIFQLSENISYVRGKHTLKWGTDIRYNRFTITNDFPSNPFFFFNGQYTGDSVADFLLGLPNFYITGRGDSTAHFRKTEWSLYGQDNFKVTPKLNLYFGLRWEYNPPFTETRDKQGYFDFRTGTVKTILADGVRRSLFIPDRNNFAPRFGFAYSVTPKTVIRGGFGLYYDLTAGNETQFFGVLNPPNFEVLNVGNSTPAPSFSLSDLFPPTDITVPASGFSPQTINPTDRTPYVYQYNLNVQRQYQGVLFEAGYIGSTGHKLNRRFNNNLAFPDPTCPPCSIPLIDRRPFPNITDALTSQNDGWSNYNGFTFKAEKPFSKGFLLLAAYTFGKHLDIGGPDEYVHRDLSGVLKDLKGPAQIDSRHRLVLTYIYELPFGKGKALASNLSGPMGKLVSGWALTGITTFSSGQPRTPNDGGFSGYANIGTPGRRIAPATCIGPLNVSSLRNSIRSKPGLFPYFDVDNIVIPPPGVVGNCGRGVIIGPGVNNWDISLMKDTQVTERMNVQFRADFFNAWNHTQFSNVGVDFISSTFGHILGARPPRDIQFGLKVLF